MIGLATCVAAVLSHDLSGVVATVLFGGVLMAAWVVPLRVTLLIVMFVGLAVDRPGDAEGRWASPFITIGGLLFQNLQQGRQRRGAEVQRRVSPAGVPPDGPGASHAVLAGSAIRRIATSSPPP